MKSRLTKLKITGTQHMQYIEEKIFLLHFALGEREDLELQQLFFTL